MFLQLGIIMIKFAKQINHIIPNKRIDMKLHIFAAVTAVILATLPTKGNISDVPEGWARCSSIDSVDDYDLTGGADGAAIVLKSNGGDMHDLIAEAVNNYDVIIFDGKNGDFEVSKSIGLYSLAGKSLIGVNGASFHTTFIVPEEVHAMLDEMDVNSLNQNAGDFEGGTLSNGSFVAELGELTIRQAMIDRYGDPKESYRQSGVFTFHNCSNIILRNLDFTGPGSLDLGGADLLTLLDCDHVWIDHCRFTDGLDGNFDMRDCDFITLSDCHFRYTDHSYNHPLSNLISGVETPEGSLPKNHISWFRCFWGEGCRGRMPLTDYGFSHIVNCYWDCTKGSCVSGRYGARLLVENSYATAKVSAALSVKDNTVQYDWRNSVAFGKPTPQSNATLSVPYSYTAFDAFAVPVNVTNSKTGAGPVLANPYSREITAAPAAIDFGKMYSGHQVYGKFNISAFGDAVPSSVTVTAPDGLLLSTAPDGEYTTSIRIDAAEDYMIQSDVYVRASFGEAGGIERLITVTTPDGSFTIPVKADVIKLEGEPVAATLVWPLDRGTSSSLTATAAIPEAFSEATIGMGDKIYIGSSRKIGDSLTFTQFNPTENIANVLDDQCYITFDVTPAPGVIFVPKKLRLNASRIYTDMCFIDIDCSRDSAEPQKLLRGFRPDRCNESPSYSEIDLPLSSLGVGNTLRVTIYLYNISANKQLALNNVVIEGDIYASRSSVETVLPSGSADGPTVFYDLKGIRIDNPQSGKPYLMRNGSESPKIVIHQ